MSDRQDAILEAMRESINMLERLDSIQSSDSFWFETKTRAYQLQRQLHLQLTTFMHDYDIEIDPRQYEDIPF